MRSDLPFCCDVWVDMHKKNRVWILLQINSEPGVTRPGYDENRFGSLKTGFCDRFYIFSQTWYFTGYTRRVKTRVLEPVFTRFLDPILDPIFIQKN